MDARNELFAYMGSCLATIVVLFGLQHWYASYLDVHVVHAQPRDTPTNAKVAAQRAAERGKLAGGAMPLADAKKAIAERGRTAFPRIAPKPSDDLSPMSGWMFRKGFAPYVSRYTPPAAAPEGGATDPAGAPAAGAPAPQAEPGAGTAIEAKP
jgi:hypothetical protein